MLSPIKIGSRADKSFRVSVW